MIKIKAIKLNPVQKLIESSLSGEFLLSKFIRFILHLYTNINLIKTPISKNPINNN